MEKEGVASVEDFVDLCFTRGKITNGSELFITGTIGKSGNKKKVVTNKFILISAFPEKSSILMNDVRLNLYKMSGPKDRKTFIKSVTINSILSSGFRISFDVNTAIENHRKMKGMVDYSRIQDIMDDFQKNQSNEVDEFYIEDEMKRLYSNIIGI